MPVLKHLRDFLKLSKEWLNPVEVLGALGKAEAEEVKAWTSAFGSKPSGSPTEDSEGKGKKPVTTKFIELWSTSPHSWEKAVQNAVTEMSKTLRNVKQVHVIGLRGDVKEGKIVEYKAHVRIGFIGKDREHHIG